MKERKSLIPLLLLRFLFVMLFLEALPLFIYVFHVVCSATLMSLISTAAVIELHMKKNCVIIY